MNRVVGKLALEPVPAGKRHEFMTVFRKQILQGLQQEFPAARGYSHESGVYYEHAYEATHRDQAKWEVRVRRGSTWGFAVKLFPEDGDWDTIRVELHRDYGLGWGAFGCVCATGVVVFGAAGLWRGDVGLFLFGGIASGILALVVKWVAAAIAGAAGNETDRLAAEGDLRQLLTGMIAPAHVRRLLVSVE